MLIKPGETRKKSYLSIVVIIQITGKTAFLQNIVAVGLMKIHQFSFKKQVGKKYTG